MHKLTKALTSVVLGGVCALSFTMTACAPEEPETEPHEHTYSDAWVYNDTQHWHPASCDDTNTVSEQAAHVDEDGDLKCDVCGYNYPHEHVFDMDKWTSDETNHWHAALCGHDAKNGEAAHTPDVTGVCTVCGYKVGDPDVSTVEKALEVALVQESLAEHAEGTKQSYNASYDRTSTYTASYDKYEDYTYTYYDGGYSVTERWFTIGSAGNMMAVESIDGATPSLYQYEFTAEKDEMRGYMFETVIGTNNYYGVTDLVEGLYKNAEASGLETTDKVEDGVYTFTYDWYYEATTTTGYDDAGNEIVGRYQYGDQYNVITVSFTLSSRNYIETVEAEVVTYDSDSLEFPEGDDEARGTLKEDAEPYTEDTYSFTQGGRNPYVYDEVIMTSFDLVDAEGNKVNGDQDVAPVTIAPYVSTTYTLDNIVPSTADGSLDKISKITLYKLNVQSGAYEPITTVYKPVNVYASATGVSISPSAEGTYRIELSSTKVTTYINLEVAYPAPTAIEATANGSSTDSYNTYVGVDVTIGGTVAYGSAAGYKAELTGDNASDALLMGDASVGYTFTTDKVGSYTVKVTSTADANVSDTITIVAAAAPEISGILNGNYVAAADYNFKTDSYIGFVPASEGALNGTLNYYFDTQYYDSYIGSCSYAYDADTKKITLSGISLADEATLTIELENYVPVATLTIPGEYGSGGTYKVNGFVVTDEEVPTERVIDVATEISWTNWYNSEAGIGLYFDSGTGYLSDGPDPWMAVSRVMFSYTIDEDNNIVITSAGDSGINPDAIAEYIALIEAGTTATYDAENDAVTFNGISFTEYGGGW